MSEPIVVRSVTISEVMDAEGSLEITIDYEGEPELWTVLGMLEFALAAVRKDIDAVWADDPDD